VADFAYPLRVGERVGGGVPDHRAVVPALFPQRPGHGDVLVGTVVAIVVVQELAEPVRLGGPQVGGDDVPADAPAGQVIQ
jgi:hypothetical protein